MNELVSVVIPVYNCYQYIDKCIESIRSQSYRNLEIILIDDGSTDGSSEKCDAFKNIDNRIMVYHQKNSGVCYSRNFGKKNASGNYIMFIDADDWIESNFVEVMLNKLLKNKVDACWSIKIFKDSEGERILSNIPIGIYNADKILHKHFHGEFISPTWTALYDLRVIDKCEFPNDIYMLEDYHFNAQVLSVCNNVMIIDDKLYHYRTNFDSASWASLNEKKLSCFHIYESLLEFYNRNNLNVPDDLIDVHVFCVKSISSMLVRYKTSKDIINTIKKNARTVLRRSLTTNLIPINQRISIILCSVSPILFRTIFGFRIKRLSHEK